METRPQISIVKTGIAYSLEILGFLIVLSAWFLVLWNYADLPETIPIHFNFSGVADRYGDRIMIFTLPGIATVIFLLLWFLVNRKPYRLFLNYPVKITEENALIQYRLMLRMIRILNCGIMLVFVLIVKKTIHVALTSDVGQGGGIYFLIIIGVLIFLPILNLSETGIPKTLMLLNNIKSLPFNLAQYITTI